MNAEGEIKVQDVMNAMVDPIAPEATPFRSVGFRHRSAQLISSVFNPFSIMGTFLVVYAIQHPAIRLGALWTLLLTIVFPGIAVLVGWARGWWAHPDLIDRRERYIFLPSVCVGIFAGRMIAGHVAAGTALPAILTTMLVYLFMVWIINFYWKISMHSSAAAGMTGLLTLLIGPWALLGLIGTAIIGWSRYELGRHTLPQTIGGALFGLLVSIVVMRLSLPI